MSTYWSPKNEAHYKQYIEDVESSNDLKAKGAMKVVTAELIGETSDLRVHGHCHCGGPICLEIGSYDKPIEEVYVPCNNGTNAEGHGLWAQVIRLIQN